MDNLEVNGNYLICSYVSSMDLFFPEAGLEPFTLLDFGSAFWIFSSLIILNLTAWIYRFMLRYEISLLGAFWSLQLKSDLCIIIRILSLWCSIFHQEGGEINENHFASSVVPKFTYVLVYWYTLGNFYCFPHHFSLPPSFLFCSHQRLYIILSYPVP